MSLWQIGEVFEGYARANDPNAGNELSPAEANDLWQWLQSDTVH